jgi:peptide chain release factor 1
LKDTVKTRLETTRDRFEEVAGLLSDPQTIANQNRFRDLSREYARLGPVVDLFRQYERLVADIDAAEQMTDDADPAVRDMGREELAALEARREALLLELQ